MESLVKGPSPIGSVRTFLLGLCILLGAAELGIAADTKPDIKLTSKAATISVTLDTKIKANAKLAAYMLADGKKWANSNLAEANKQFKESPEFFSGGRTWELERDYTLQSTVANRYVSILRNEFTFTGGAHPNRGFETFLWDDQAKKPISIRPFFTELKDGGPALTAILKAVIASLIEEKKARDTYFPDDLGWQKYIEPKLLKIGPVLLAPSTVPGKSSGLEFQYGPYAVGAYAEGSYEAFVPWSILKPYLSPEGVAIFGGERPAESGKSEK
ncbi:MAG: PdaC/SigV domain-containing protein [Afipia sp.]